mmetsp:Transcript_21661/g.32336  ORF Transcript_21661/g.32336 Transcript_21661/m.32336 type:complete len:374 (+) Transcript_21661:92-1213(+)
MNYIQHLPVELITKNIFDFCSGKTVSTATQVFATSPGFTAYKDFSDLINRRFQALATKEALPDCCYKWLGLGGWFGPDFYIQVILLSIDTKACFCRTKLFMRKFSEQALILEFFEDALQRHVLQMKVNGGDSSSIKAAEWPMWCGEIAMEQKSQTGSRLMHHVQHLVLTTPGWDVLQFIQWNTDSSTARTCVGRGMEEQMRRLQPTIQHVLPFGTAGRLRGLTAEDGQVLHRIAKVLRESDNCIMRTWACHSDESSCTDVIFVSRLQTVRLLMHSRISGSSIAEALLSKYWSLRYHFPSIDETRNNGDSNELLMFTPLDAQGHPSDDYADDVMLFFHTPDKDFFTEDELQEVFPLFVKALITYFKQRDYVWRQ